MNASASHRPSAYVLYGGIITSMSKQLHDGGSLQGSCAFALTQDYALCVVGAPAFLLGFGLASMLFMNLFLLLRYFMPSLRCMPDFRESHVEKELATCCWKLPFETAFDAKSSDHEKVLLAALLKKRLSRFRHSIGWFAPCLLLCLVLPYVANDSMDRAVAKAQASLAPLRSSLKPIAADVQVLFYQSTLISSALSSSSAQQCGGQADKLQAQVSALADLIASTAAALGLAQRTLSVYMGHARHYTVACLSVLPVFFAAAFPYLSRSKERVLGLKWLMAAAVVYYYFCCIAAFPIFFVVSGMGEFAASPYQRLLSVVPGAALRNLTAHYSTCAGESVLEAYMASAQLTADSLRKQLQACAHLDAGATIARNTSVLMSATLRNRGHGPAAPCMILTVPGVVAPPVPCVLDLPDCPVTRALLSDAVEAVVDLYPGLLQLGLTLLLCSFLLWLLVVLSALLYPHFDYLPASTFNYRMGQEEDLFPSEPSADAREEKTGGQVVVRQKEGTVKQQPQHQHQKSTRQLNRVACILVESSDGGGDPLSVVVEQNDDVLNEEEAEALRFAAVKAELL